MRTRNVAFVVMFAFLALAIPAGAQEEPNPAVKILLQEVYGLTDGTDREKTLKAVEVFKVYGNDVAKIETYLELLRPQASVGAQVQTPQAVDCDPSLQKCKEEVKVNGDIKDVTAKPEPLSIEEIERIIDNRIESNTKSRPQDLNDALGKYFGSEEMASVFKLANEMREKGLEDEAERMVRKVIGRDRNLARAWDKYKDQQEAKRKADKQLREAMAATQLRGCADDPPTRIDKSLTRVIEINVRGLMATHNDTNGGKAELQDENGRTIVDKLCDRGFINLRRNLMTVVHGTSPVFVFKAIVTRPDGTSFQTFSPPMGLQTCSSNFWCRMFGTWVWEITDPLHPPGTPPAKPVAPPSPDAPEEPPVTPASQDPVLEEEVIEEQAPQLVIPDPTPMFPDVRVGPRGPRN